MISTAMIIFDLNFSFEFLYNFTGQLRLVMVMVKGFGKYYRLFKIHTLVTILFFQD